MRKVMRERELSGKSYARTMRAGVFLCAKLCAKLCAGVKVMRKVMRDMRAPLGGLLPKCDRGTDVEGQV